MAKLTKAGFARAKRELGLKGKLTRKQVQRVFKRAIKNLGRKSPSKSRTTRSKTTKRKTKSNPKGGKNRMGRKGKSLVQTAYKLIPMIALAAPAIGAAARPISGKAKIAVAIRAYTGYSLPNMDLGTKGFNVGHLAEGWAPFIASSLVIKGAQKLRGLISRI